MVSVVLFHFFPGAFPFGYLGVDGFFVVSGYVLAPQLLNIFSSQKPILNYIEFIKRRFWRLYPAFLVSIVISLVILFLFISPNVHERSLMQILYSLVNLGDFGAFKFSGDYFDPSQNPFVHFWSLSVEWQFYLLFPLLTILFLRLRNGFTPPKFHGILVIVTLLSLMVWLLQDNLEQMIVTLGLGEYSLGLGYYIGIGRFWQFLIGLAAFEVTRRCKRFSTKYLNSFLSIALLVTLLWRHPHDIYGSVWITLLTVLLLIFSPKGISLFKYFGTEKFFLSIGNISYSVYLIHFPFVVAWNQNSLLFDLNPIEDAAARILICVVIVVIGYFIFKNVENRYRATNSLSGSVFTRKIYVPIVMFMLSLGVFFLGMSSSYFGLERNIQKPPYETFIGESCSGNSQNATPCIGNEDGTKGAVVLLGDSHAEHFSKTFYESAKSLDLKYYGIGFCAPSLKGYTDQREGCLRFSQNAKSQIEKIRPEILVVSVLISSDEMLRAVLSYISEIRDSVGQVMVLTNSPYFVEPIFVSKPLIHGTEEFSKGSFEKEMNLAFRSFSTDFAIELERSGIKTIDLWPLFCAQTFCSRFDRGNWLFVDQHHFSSFGAARLGPLFLELLGSKDVEEVS